MNTNSTKTSKQFLISRRIWLTIYVLANTILALSFLYAHVLIVPLLAFALFNLYAIALLFRQNRQGFYSLICTEIIFFIYSIIMKKPQVFFSVIYANIFFIVITWFFVRNLWDHDQK